MNRRSTSSDQRDVERRQALGKAYFEKKHNADDRTGSVRYGTKDRPVRRRRVAA